MPEDDVPDELLSVVQQEDDDEIAQQERESYLVNMVSDDARDDMMLERDEGIFSFSFKNVKIFCIYLCAFL